MNKKLESIKAFIDRYDSFLISGHQDPDGDCVASQLALGSFLTRLGKKVIQFSPGPFSKPEISKYESLFLQQISDEAIFQAVLLVDISSTDRAGSLEASVKDKPIGIIDHHLSGEVKGEAVYLDPSIPAATLMVQDIIESYNIGMEYKEAEYIFFGFSTDSGFFRHLDEHSSSSLERVSRLIAKGVSPKKIYQNMNRGYSLSTRKLMGVILQRATAYYDGKLIIICEYKDDRKKLEATDKDSGMLYQLLLSVEGCEAVISIREESENKCFVGLRSNSYINVGDLASRFKGGGHFFAAGFSSDSPMEDLKKQIVTEFQNYL